MWFAAGLLLLIAASYGQEAQPEGSIIEASQVGEGEREPLFFYTITITITSTLSTTTSTVLSTVTTCTSTSAGAAACAGKRRRRGILLSDEEYLGAEIIKPTAVNAVEATQSPVIEFEAKREAREAQFFDYNHYFPLLPTFNQVPYNPKFNPYYGALAPYFRQGLPPQLPEERFRFSFTTTTATTFTSTSTSTTFTATTSLIVQCTAASSFSACGSG